MQITMIKWQQWRKKSFDRWYVHTWLEKKKIIQFNNIFPQNIGRKGNDDVISNSQDYQSKEEEPIESFKLSRTDKIIQDLITHTNKKIDLKIDSPIDLNSVSEDVLNSNKYLFLKKKHTFNNPLSASVVLI